MDSYFLKDASCCDRQKFHMGRSSLHEGPERLSILAPLPPPLEASSQIPPLKVSQLSHKLESANKKKEKKKI